MRYEGIQSFYDFRNYSPDQLKKDAQKLIDVGNFGMIQFWLEVFGFQDAKAVYDAVGAVDSGKVTFDNVIQPLLDIERDSYTKGVALQLPSMVALDKDLRDASSDAEKQMDEFSVEMSMRKDIFDNIVAFSLTDDAKALDPELARFVEKSVIEGRRNGLHLPEDKRLEIKDIKKRISDLGVDFNKNLNEDTTFLLFDKSELEGVPEDLVNSFEK